MCELCKNYNGKIAQFRRALSHVFDAVSKDRISEALRDLEAAKPQCTDPVPLSDEELKVEDLQLHRISKALDALALPEVRALVEEIETVLKPNTD